MQQSAPFSLLALLLKNPLKIPTGHMNPASLLKLLQHTQANPDEPPHRAHWGWLHSSIPAEQADQCQQHRCRTILNHSFSHCKHTQGLWRHALLWQTAVHCHCPGHHRPASLSSIQFGSWSADSHTQWPLTNTVAQLQALAQGIKWLSCGSMHYTGTPSLRPMKTCSYPILPPLAAWACSMC